MKFKRNRRSVIVVATSVAALGLGVSVLAAPASVAAALPHGGVTPHISCGWTPVNNSHIAGSYFFNSVNIHSGPGQECRVVDTAGLNDNLDVRCIFYGSPDGFAWDYLTDSSQGVTGWVRDDLVWWPITPQVC